MKPRTTLNVILTVFVGVFAVPVCANGKTIYVDADATGTNDGSSWADAYYYPQDALMFAVAGDEIRVAQGVYNPDDFVLSDRPSRGREETFQLIDGVTLKGGYPGLGQPDPNARDIELYTTVLTGDLLGNDTFHLHQDENSYTVVNASGTDEFTVLDGFTIRGGNSDGELFESQRKGAGMYILEGNPAIKNCTFIDNTVEGAGYRCGGGIYMSSSNPTISNCFFSNNWVLTGGTYTGHGGAIHNEESSPTIENCTFSGNQVVYGWGGAIHNEEGSNPIISGCTFNNLNESDYGAAISCHDNSSPIITDCLIVGNSAYDLGGGIHCETYSNPSISNCLVINNESDEGCGGGISCVNNSSPTITNCTIIGNEADGGRGTAFYTRDDSDPVIRNTIIWYHEPGRPLLAFENSNPSIAYCNIQEHFEGQGNISEDPLFADPTAGDYHLKSQAGRWDPNEGRWTIDDVTSPCIDAGDPMSPIGLEPFPNGGVINMGADGGTGEASKSYFGGPPCETIVAGDINGDCEVNFEDFRLMALHWLEEH